MNRGALVCTAALGLALGLSATPVRAQAERADDIVGTLTAVNRGDLTVKRDGGAEVRVRVSAGTEVYFRDSGDRRKFSNPSINDLQPGMGVRFATGSTNLSRIVVHFVPAGMGRGAAQAAPQQDPGRSGGADRADRNAPSDRDDRGDRGDRGGESRKVKARIKTVGRREMEADVAGRNTTFALDSPDIGRRFEAGDLVILTVEGRPGRETVTRIDSAELRGTVSDIDPRGRSISIRVGSQEETYSVQDRDVTRDVHRGDRVRFEVEERGGGRKVVTAISRDR